MMLYVACRRLGFRALRLDVEGQGGLGLQLRDYDVKMSACIMSISSVSR